MALFSDVPRPLVPCADGLRFECPECEFDHTEAGFLVGADVVHCPLCYEDNARLVVLRKW